VTTSKASRPYGEIAASTGLMAAADSRLRLQTIVRLRWLAVLGQLLTIGGVSAGLGFSLPLGPCLVLIAMSAWLNVFLSIRYPARYRLSVRFASLLLAYDILQLAGLLYLTGGIDNPFTMLIVAPVTVSAATLPIVNTVLLGLLAAAATVFITLKAWPLPWFDGGYLENPSMYRAGMLAAVVSGMTFLALYAWRLAKESRQMSAALAATELVLAREQKLHALDGLAAAAAHELGTPLSTITLVTHELERQMSKEDPHLEDIHLLREQAQRCREILRKLTRHPAEQDPLHESVSVSEMLAEAAAPYENVRVPILIRAAPTGGVAGPAARMPVASRRPGVIYGLGNILENSIDFAGTRVDVGAEWDGTAVTVTISDDGPGFKPEIIDTLGEPYVTTRPAGAKKRDGHKVAGLGLGFFIAKTLLERSGARLTLENKPAPEHGAIVRIVWTRAAFEAPVTRGETGEEDTGFGSRHSASGGTNH
jgi:two-component system sensor histidine kinase RegB